MSTRPLARLGAAVVLAVGLLAATAAPASATAHDLAVGGSSSMLIVEDFDPAKVTASSHFDDGHATSHVCAPNSTTPTIPADLGSTGSGTIGAATTAWFDLTFFLPTTPVTVYDAKARFVITGGTVTTTATTITITMTFKLEIRSCASTTTLCTTNSLGLTLTGANGTGSLHPGVSSTFLVSGTTTAITVSAVPACNAIIRAAILNQTALIDLNLHVAT